MTRFMMIPALALSLALAGCSQPPAEQSAEQPGAESASQSETHGSAPAGGPEGASGNAPFPVSPAAGAGGGGGAPQTPPLAGEWKAKADKVNALNEKLEASPDDEKLKAEAVAANYELGNGLMNAPDLPPYKYRHALKYLRAARDLDPNHEKAAADIKQIEDIYKMMGRPIPQ
ncbi:MAG: hypothetical protein ACK47B_06205 [Armatimonadota bacterium]